MANDAAAFEASAKRIGIYSTLLSVREEIDAAQAELAGTADILERAGGEVPTEWVVHDMLSMMATRYSATIHELQQRLAASEALLQKEREEAAQLRDELKQAKCEIKTLSAIYPPVLRHHQATCRNKECDSSPSHELPNTMRETSDAPQLTSHQTDPGSILLECGHRNVCSVERAGRVCARALAGHVMSTCGGFRWTRCSDTVALRSLTVLEFKRFDMDGSASMDGEELRAALEVFYKCSSCVVNHAGACDDSASSQMCPGSKQGARDHNTRSAPAQSLVPQPGQLHFGSVRPVLRRKVPHVHGSPTHTCNNKK